MKRYFITGTDTGCGKTYVTCRLLEHFKKQGKKVLAIKPVASGVVSHQGQWVNEDVLALQQYNQEDILICPWLLQEPISPHLAAQQEGRVLSAEDIAADVLDERFAGYDILLIEGAGGLMVPLNQEETWLDVLQRIPCSVIFVVGMRLGCLNHALLSASVMRAHGIDCIGWIANIMDPTMLALEGNIKTLQDKLPWPFLSHLRLDGALNDEISYI